MGYQISANVSTFLNWRVAYLKPNSTFTILAVSAICLFFLIYGPFFVDPGPTMALSLNPFRLEDPDFEYFTSSFLLYFLGYVAGLDSRVEYIIFYTGAVLLAGFSLIFYVLNRWSSMEDRATALALIGLSPIFLVLISWIGKSDPAVVFFTVLLTLSPNPAVIWLWAALLLCAHQEQGLAIIVIHWLARETNGIRLASLVAGVMVGLITGYLYKATLGLESSGRADMLGDIFWLVVASNLAQPASTLMLDLTWFWGAIALAAISGLMRWRLWAALAIAIGVGAFTADTTRVTVLLSLPVLLAVTELLIDRHGRRLAPVLPIIVIAAFVQAQKLGFGDGAPRVRDINWVHVWKYTTNEPVQR
ncbi:hypothetical protein [Chthonobacter rhizosphaerae]|uniref:hypothetical protein n=1 Tax=Chthonobacter rhizosphaerae TaxID=2735553 RepID=UPI0015EEA926|nr:hypothetical protein [Chthonobacter rhizosphaerae]